MKATLLLEKQHRKIEALFKKLERGRADAAPMVTELAADLAAHMVIEEEFFYPAARRFMAALVLEGAEEHMVARFALKRLVDADRDDETFLAKVSALKGLIEHHVKEEEEELFPEVAAALGDDASEALGASMKARFDVLVESGYEAAVSTNTSTDHAMVDGAGRLDGASHVDGASRGF